ncbi:MAG: hypothetical protein GKR89_16585 [Candidatus Latescibacteria bacterium]|nr:hypothetical protein [Candidatus Latescibacterota bacterium]
MVKHILLLAGLVAGCGGGPASPPGPTVLNESFLIESRADIDRLSQRGGAAFTIAGDLQISGQLPSLEGLEGLTRVEGSLEIWFNPNLIWLKGLEGLESVGGKLGGRAKSAHVVEGLLIFENAALVSLAGLENLAAVGGGLSITGNPSLTGLADLPRLTGIEGSLDIWFNDNLVSLEGLQRLARVKDFLEVSGNGALANLAGLRGVDHVGAGLIVTNNGRLPSSQAWDLAERLRYEGLDIQVENNGSL